MTTATVTPPAAEQTIHDLIDPERWYGIDRVSRLLDIPANDIRTAHSMDKLGETKHKGGGLLVRGDNLIKWVEADNIWQKLNPDRLKAVDKITAADVLDPEKRYNAAQVEDLLGISQRTFINAVKTAPQFFETWGSGIYRQYSGSAILSWIEKDKIQFRVMPLAVSLYLREHRPPAHRPKPTKSLTDRVFDRVEQHKRQAEAEECHRQNEMCREYLYLAGRGDDLADANVQQLAELVEKLGIDRNQMIKDRKLMETCRKVWARYEEAAKFDHRDCQTAARRNADQLQEYRKRRPQIFIENTSPPRPRPEFLEGG